MSKLPIDDKDGLIVTLSVMRKGTGELAEHFMEDKHIQTEGELKNIAIQGGRIIVGNKGYK